MGVAKKIDCPYLDGIVDLTDERRDHIELKHPELVPGRLHWLFETLLEPAVIVRSRTWDGARLFVRRYDSPGRTRFVVVVVATDPPDNERHWIVTAYLSRDLPKGVIEWPRS